MSKKYYVCYVVILFVIVAGFGIGTFLLPKEEFLENENRYRNEFMDFSLQNVLSGEFQEHFENAFADYFPAREVWMGASTEFKQVLGFRDVNGAYIGKDGYYLAKNTAETIEQKNYMSNLRYVEYFGSLHEKKVSLLLAPSSGTIMKSKLPSNAPYYDANAMYDGANTMLKQTKLIDVRDSMTEYAKQNQVYFRTDHHWTLLGAYAAYSEYYDQTKKDKHTYGYFSPKKVSDSFYGTMYSKVLDAFAKPDDLYAATNVPQTMVQCDGKRVNGIYDVEQLLKKDKYAYFFGGNYGEIVISMKAKPKKKLLVIKDSYANNFVPFVLEDFDSVTMIDLRYYKKSVQELVREEGYSEILVLYEMSSFAQDTNLYKLVH